MNKEILKEIECYQNDEMCVIMLSQKENKALLDYISNLQQENKQLKEELDYIKPRYDIAMDLVDKGVENSYKMVKDYKFRCEKAIEYIKNEEHNKWIMYGRNVLLKILGDKENEHN